MKRINLLCALAALCAFAVCSATNAKEPEASVNVLKGKVSLKDASLKKADAAGKYAQSSDDNQAILNRPNKEDEATALRNSKSGGKNASVGAEKTNLDAKKEDKNALKAFKWWKPGEEAEGDESGEEELPPDEDDPDLPPWNGDPEQGQPWFGPMPPPLPLPNPWTPYPYGPAIYAGDDCGCESCCGDCGSLGPFPGRPGVLGRLLRNRGM